MPLPDVADPLQVGQRLAELVRADRRTSTYDLALLLALVDACTEAGAVLPDPLHPAHPDREPLGLRVEDLADRMMELYWQQVRPAGTGLLSQGKGPRQQAVIVEEVAALASAARAEGLPTAHAVATRLPRRYAAARRRVARLVAQQPLRALQSPDGATGRRTDFLYDSSWSHKRLTQAELDARGGTVELRPGVAPALARLGTLLRPLVEQAWTTHVAAVNEGHGVRDLRAFLFDLPTAALAPLAGPLLQGQEGRCFWCRERLTRDVRVDPFVPWSRFPMDSAAGLVAADARCQDERGTSLPALSQVFRWQRRPPLEQLVPVGWPVEGERARRIMQGAYAALPPGTPLWAGRGTWERSDGTEGTRVRSLLAG